MYWKCFWFWQEISPKKFENYFLYSSRSEICIFLFHLPHGRIGQIYPNIARILLEGNFSVAAGKKNEVLEAGKEKKITWQTNEVEANRRGGDKCFTAAK